MKQSDYAIRQIERNKPENHATYERIFAKAIETSVCMTTGLILMTSQGKINIVAPIVFGLASYQLVNSYKAAKVLADYSAQLDEDDSQKVFKKINK